MSRIDLGLRDLGDRPRVDVAAVPDHRDEVGERGDLLEPVADVEDRDAAVAQPAHGREQVLDLVGRERGGRLVHDQEPRARRERLRDLEQLPVGDAQAADRRVGRRCRPRARRGCAAVSRRIAPQSTVCRRLRMWRPEKTFSATRQVLEDGRLLVHRHDPEPVRRLRVGDARAARRRPRLARRPAGRRRSGSSRASTCPAPFSPTSACTVPGRIAKLTSSTGEHAAVAPRDAAQLDQRSRPGRRRAHVSVGVDSHES